MPHVIVKMLPGRTEDQKQRLAEAITKDIMAIAKCEEKSVSVAIEEKTEANGLKSKILPDILDIEVNLYKKWGYNLLDKSQEKTSPKATQTDKYSPTKPLILQFDSY